MYWQTPIAMLRALKRADDVDSEQAEERRKPTVERRLQAGAERHRRLTDELAKLKRRR